MTRGKRDADLLAVCGSLEILAESQRAELVRRRRQNGPERGLIFSLLFFVAATNLAAIATSNFFFC